MTRARELANFADNTAGLETLTVSDITDLTATATELNQSWHSGNDGAGSGLDADTVDSIQASSFLRSDADTTFNASGNNFNFDYDSTQRTLWTAQQSGTIKLSLEGNGNALSFALHNSGTLELPASTTFGGVATSSFLRSDAVDSASGTYTLSGGGDDVSDTPVLNLTAGYISVPHDEVLLKFDEGQKMITSNDNAGNFNIRSGHDNDQLHVGTSSGNSGMSAISLDSDGQDGEIHLYVGPQRSAGSTANAEWGLTVKSGSNGLLWRTGSSIAGSGLSTTYSVWHAGNDGAGSGLDADTLDGNQGSYYAPIANPSFTGDMTLTDSGTPTLVVTTSATSGEDAHIKIKGARTGDPTGTTTSVQFINVASTGSYDMARIVGHMGASSTNKEGELAFHVNSGNNLQEKMRIDKDGNLKFDSGFGSVATAYGCRAFVQFDGEDTSTGNNVAIRVSKNISSVVDRGTGWYEVNLDTAMPNDKYCALATGTGGSTSNGYIQMDSHNFGGVGTDDQHVSSSRFNLRGVSGGSGSTYIDHPIVCAAVFR